MDLGHLDKADVTVTLDYDTAKAVFVDGTVAAAMTAFMEGKVRVQGEMAKLLAALRQLTPARRVVGQRGPAADPRHHRLAVTAAPARPGAACRLVHRPAGSSRSSLASSSRVHGRKRCTVPPWT